MNRRNFLVSMPVAGIAAGGASFLGGCLSDGKDSCLFDKGDRMKKVILAMLSIQRACWEQGVAMQALLEKGEKELVILMAKDAVLRQAGDGRLAILGEQHPLTDAASPGEAVRWAAAETGDEVLMKGFEKLRDYMLHKAPRNEQGIVFHFTNVRQFWSDSNYMLPPFLAAAGAYEEALKQIAGYRKYLWNEEKKLFSHIWDCDKNDFARKDFWGVGNGWTAAGYTRVINQLPEKMDKEKQRLIGYTHELLEGCIRFMREDGLFHNVLDDRGSFVETNLSQQLAYTIYTGIHSGWLPDNYKEYADKMRTAALARVDEMGLVQGVCGSPDFNHPGTAVEGQAFHILMEVAHGAL